MHMNRTERGRNGPRAGDDLRRDLRFAIRSLSRSPGYVLTAVLSLALGMGASAAAIGVLDAVRFRALPFPDADRLLLISEVPATQSSGQPVCQTACNVGYETWAQVLRPHAYRTLDAIVAFTSGGKSLNLGDAPIGVVGGVVSPNVFDLLRVRPLRGRAFSDADNRVGAEPVTILSHDLWTRSFGQDPAIIGRTVKLSDTQYTVIGIMPPGFDFELGSDFWLPDVPTLDPSTRPSIRSIIVAGRLAPGATLAQARAELAALVPLPITGDGVAPAPPTVLQAAPLRLRYVSSTASHDVIFALIAGCVLLIACANLANLTLVRALHQQREYVTRMAIGASPWRLVRQQFTQHMVLVLAGTLVGLVLAWKLLALLAAAPVLRSLRPTGMEYRLDARVVACTLALAVLAAALLSVVPARLVARANAPQVLRETSTSASGGRWGRNAQRLFVTLQIAVAVVLLTGAGLLARTAARLARVNVGFNAAHVLQASPSLPHTWRVEEIYLPLFDRILLELGQLPGASAVALRATTPLAARGNPEVVVEGRNDPLAPALLPQIAFTVSEQYFDALSVPVLHGRAFSSSNVRAAPPVAIVNEWAAKRWWPGEDPVGRTLRISAAGGSTLTLTVVGVAADNKAAQPGVLVALPGPEIYRPFAQAPSAFPTFFVRSATPGTVLRPMRDLMLRLVPDRPLFAARMSDRIDQQLGGVRGNALQSMGFAGIGLVLGLIGIYGVLAYTVRRRVREIAIRSALGATRGRVQFMILGEALRMAGAGLLAGVLLAALSTRLLDGLLYGTSRTDPAVHVGVALAVVAVTLFAGWIPAQRAARVDPNVALRDT